MSRSVKSSTFHTNLINAIDDLLEVNRKFQETTDVNEKNRWNRRFNAMWVEVDKCIRNYNVDKLKFTVLDDKGKRKNAG